MLALVFVKPGCRHYHKMTLLFFGDHICVGIESHKYVPG